MMGKTTLKPSRLTQLNDTQIRPPSSDSAFAPFDECQSTFSITDNANQLLRRRHDTKSEQRVLFALLSHNLDAADAGRATENLLQTFGSFAEVVAAPKFALAQIEGVTDASIDLFKAIELAAQTLGEATLKSQPILNSWPRLTQYLTLTMARQRNEIAKALFLDAKNRLIADEVLNIGDVTFVQISIRKILARALELNSTAIIIAHNHPSGDPTPSEHDKSFTRDFCIAASYMDVVVHDHIVVGRGRYFSFRREGLMA